MSRGTSCRPESFAGFMLPSVGHSKTTNSVCETGSTELTSALFHSPFSSGAGRKTGKRNDRWMKAGILLFDLGSNNTLVQVEQHYLWLEVGKNIEINNLLSGERKRLYLWTRLPLWENVRARVQFYSPSLSYITLLLRACAQWLFCLCRFSAMFQALPPDQPTRSSPLEGEAPRAKLPRAARGLSLYFPHRHIPRKVKSQFVSFIIMVEVFQVGGCKESRSYRFFYDGSNRGLWRRTAICVIYWPCLWRFGSTSMTAGCNPCWWTDVPQATVNKRFVPLWWSNWLGMSSQVLVVVIIPF